MANNIAIRLQAEGGPEIRRVLDDTGRAGQDAFREIGTAADAAGAAADRLTQKTRAAGDAARSAQSSAASASSGSTPQSSPATTAAVNRIRSQLDEEYRKQTQAERAGRLISQGEASGQFTPAYADRLRTLSDRKYGPQNDNTREGLSSYDRLFVKYQAIDSAQQLASGASPGLVALQQGGQVFQQLSDREGGLGAGLKQLAVSAGALVTPFAVAGAAVTAAAAVFAYGAYQASRDQSTLEKATQGLGRSTGASVGQLEDLAQANAAAGKVSTSTAREYAAAYASAGTVALPVIGDLISKTGEYARITGQDATSAAGDLARAFADPAKGADDLNSKIGGLDDVTRQHIVTLEQAGDRMGAATALAAYLKQQIDANAASTTGWAGAWNTATAAADRYWEAAKRAVSVRLQQWGVGSGPTASQSELDRLNAQIEQTNRNRAKYGMGDLTYQNSSDVRRRDDMLNEVERANKKAADEKFLADAKADSLRAGEISRGIDPMNKVYDDLISKRNQLDRSLDSPTSRSSLVDIEQTERDRKDYNAAIESMTDANGKLITSAELSRRQDQLRIDTLKATTTEEKAALAEQQKRLDLIGKVTRDRDGQISRAGLIARAEASSKGGGSDSDPKDDYDRAERSVQDRIRRQQEQAETYGLSAEAVERYRTQTELLTAAKRAERDITPELTANIEKYAAQAADAAKRVEDARESSRRSDEYRSIGSDGVRTLVRDLADGAKAGKILDDVLGSLKNRIADLAANSISDALFGRRGSGDSGALGSLFSGLTSSGGGATAASASTGGTGLMGALRSLFGFSEGGFTGFSDRGAIAGFVHGREYVFDAEATSRIGVGNLEAMRRGARGYAGGGYVGAKAFAGGSNDNGGPPNITFVTPPGVALEQDGPARRRSDGSYEQVLKTVETGLAGRAASNRGPFQQAVGGPGFRKG